MSNTAPRDNLKGGAWLIADMSLNIWALSLVKWLGAEYPAMQVVFLRAITGLVLILPLIWINRAYFRHIEYLGLHLLRVVLSLITLTASFFAISRIPLAVFTAISFTRPIVTMILAAILLHEAIGPRRWVAAAVAFLGVLIAANPGAVPWSLGLAAQGVVVLTGSAAIIATRRLREAPAIVLMTFYTAGLTVFSAPLAVAGWQIVAPTHVAPLLAVGVFAQAAQLCFLRAHYHGEAGFLSVLGYLSLLLSVGVGFFVFDEIPGPEFVLGAGLVVAAATGVVLRPAPTATRN